MIFPQNFEPIFHIVLFPTLLLRSPKSFKSLIFHMQPVFPLLCRERKKKKIAPPCPPPPFPPPLLLIYQQNLLVWFCFHLLNLALGGFFWPGNSYPSALGKFSSLIWWFFLNSIFFSYSLILELLTIWMLACLNRSLIFFLSFLLLFPIFLIFLDFFSDF